MTNHRDTCQSGGACLECDGYQEKELMAGHAECHAERHNSGKVDLSLLPRVASLEQCKVWMRGREKYGKDNWKLLWGDRTIDVAGASAMRHLLSLLDGELMDRETGLPHAAHVSCNMSMILEWMAREGKIEPESYVNIRE